MFATAQLEKRVRFVVSPCNDDPPSDKLFQERAAIGRREVLRNAGWLSLPFLLRRRCRR